MTPQNPSRSGHPRAAERWAAHHRLLTETLIRSGVDLSYDDHNIVERIAGQEPDTVRTITSWVLRASVAARTNTPGDALDSAPPGV